MRINVVRLEVIKDKSVEYGSRNISKAADLADLGFKLVGKADREVFLAVCLNAKNNINAVHAVSIGSLTSSVVHPREVYKLAVITNSASIALLHNHPSGIAEPSREDIEITRRLIETGNVLGIKILDHVIIGDDTFYSFMENNTCDFK